MTFSISPGSDDVIDVTLAGELDATTAGDLSPTLGVLGERRPSRVNVDLSQLRMIDTIGLGVLVGFYKRLRQHGGHVMLRRPRGQPLAILLLARLERMIERPEIGGGD
jgi:anti-sigma B factor antagonist